MTEEQSYTTRLQSLLDRWNDGDESVIDQIIVHSQERLRQMAHNMLARKPHVRRHQETDDVLQNAFIRLHRALRAVKPESKAAFNGLAATQIRRELIDMARSLFGPEGHGKHYRSDPGLRGSSETGHPLYEKADLSADPVAQLELHECVDSLPEDERTVFELIFYQGMTQVEVAGLLNVAERTVRRRWRLARQSLQAALVEAPKSHGEG
jgi:RNA polymerase sigma factor (sigma-70 family)